MRNTNFRGERVYFFWRILTFRNVGLGGGEGLLDDEGLAAAHQVLGNHPEVVGGVLLQAPDLDGGEAGGAHLTIKMATQIRNWTRH